MSHAQTSEEAPSTTISAAEPLLRTGSPTNDERLRLKKVTKSVSETFYFSLEGLGSWMSVTVTEDTGELSIQSDWGPAGYRWNPNALGVEGEDRLKRFLGGTSEGYVWNKCAIEHGALKAKRIDTKKTKEPLFKKILETRRKGYDLSYYDGLGKVHYVRFDKDTARMYWEEVERWDLEGSMDLVYMSTPKEVSHLCDSEPWHAIEEEYTGNAKLWRDTLIPMMCSYFKEHYPKEPLRS